MVVLRDVAYEDSHTRCRTCGKREMVDVGGGLDGEVTASTWCPDCGPSPDGADWASGLLAAIAVVTARRLP